MSIIKKIKTTIKQEISQIIRYRTELVLIDESELSELQDQAALWNRKSESSVLRQQIATLEERLGRAVDYQGKLISDAVGYADKCEDLKQTIQEMEDRAQELQGELDNWQSLGSGYGLNLDVSDVGEKLEILEEWEDLMGRGWSPSEIEEKLEAADDWNELEHDTGMQPCEIQKELDRLQEVDADLEEANNKLASLQYRLDEAVNEWHPDEAIEQIQSFQMAVASALENSKS